MDLAQAYVQILPSTDGIKENLTSVLSDAGTSAGQTAGSRIGSALSAGMKVGTVAMSAVTAGITAVSGAFVAGAGSVASYGDNIDKMSQKMGMSAEAYQEWDAVMQHSGTSMESMKSSMKTLATAVESGNDAFERIGLTQEELAGMSQEDIFAATITGLQNVDDETERTYLASQLLGRGATELGALLNTSAEDTQAMKDRVHELGGVMSDEAVKSAAKYQDSLQDMTTALDGVKRGIMSEFLPSITTAMDGIANLFSGNSEEGLGQIKEGVSQFIATLTDAIPKVIEVAGGIVGALGEAIIENLPSLLDAGLQAIITLANGISQSLPKMVPQIVEVVTKMVEVLTNPDTLTALLTAALAIIVALAEGIIKSIPKLIEALPQIISNLVTFFVNSGPQIAKAGFDLLVSLVKNMPQIASSIANSIPQIISSIVTAIGNGIVSIANAGYNLLTHLGDKFTNVGTWIGNKVKSIPSAMIKGIQSTVESFKDVGKNLISGVWNGFIEKWNELSSKVQEWGDNFIGFVNAIFGNASPSKKFKKIGGFLSAGLAIGIQDNAYLAEDAMSGLSDSVTSAVGAASMSVSMTPAYASQGQTFEVPRYGAGAGSGQREAILMVDKEVLGRVVFNLYNDNSTRVGVQIAGGVA